MTDVSLLLHPALPLLVAAAVVAVVPRRAGHVAALAGPLGALALVVAVRGGVGPSFALYGITLAPLRADDLATIFAGVFAVAIVLTQLYGLSTAARAERVSGLVTAAAAIGVVLAGDLVTLFLWWELKAVSTTVVIAVGGGERSTSAALRYLYAHLVGGAALLAGVAWHLGATGSAAFGALELGPATVLIAAGFLLSAAAPPLHAWLPDAYPAASVTGSVLLSAFTTKAAVYALARGFPGTEVLLWVGVAMALYGVVFAMLQDDLRGLLSYHIVSQVGFMVAAVGVGTADAINGATAHAAAHILYKGLLLMGVGAVIHATGRTRATDLGGLAKAMPAVLVLYVVGAVSISGVPGFSGFVSKELSIHAIDEAGAHAALIALKIASVGTLLSTLGKLPYAVWFARPAAGEPAPIVRRPARSMYAAMALAATACVAIGVAPALLWDLLPATNTYTPLYLGKVLETVQLLGIAAVGFWLLRRELAPHAGTVLDVDRLYRARRWTTLGAWSPYGARDGAAATDRPEARPGGVRLDRVRAVVTALPRTRPTWWFGVVLTTAAVLILLGSLS